MVWFSLAGVVLEAFGLFIAIRGVAKTYQEAVGRQIWPEIADQVTQWVQTRLRRKPRHVVGKAISITATSKISVGGEVKVGSSTPRPDAPAEEQIAYLRQAVDALSGEVQRVREESRAMVKESEDRLGKLLGALSERVDDTGDRLGKMWDAVLGREGKGLLQAAVGLGITLVGVVLSIAGPLQNWIR